MKLSNYMASLTGYRFGVIILLFLFVATFLSIADATIEAAANGTIEGKIANMTQGGDSVAGLPVSLHLQKDNSTASNLTSISDIQNILLKEARADDGGKFQFSDVDANSSNRYLVIAQYKGVEYSQPLSFQGGQPSVSVNVSVYETTNSDVGLRMSSGSLIIAGVDEAAQTVIAMEVATLVNPSDKTYLPDPRGPQGPMGLPRFSLPPGATDLTMHQGIDDLNQVMQVDKGFAVMAPLRPGSKEFIFAYRLPYQGSSVSLSKSLSMGAEQFLVLAQKGKWSVSSAQLTSQGIASIGGKDYFQLTGAGLAGGSTVVIEINGLPGNNPFMRSVSSVPTVAWGGIGTMMAVGVALYFMSARGLIPIRASVPIDRASSIAWPAAVTPAGGSSTLSQRLLLDIAELDERHMKGLVSDEEHRKLRDMLKDYAKAVMKSEVGETQPSVPNVQVDGGSRDRNAG
ncbi:MAG: hypothetical protein EXR50_05170 [Dehalococcoidia bacterium]|nr:hypothetical protein [Dehalococcoidia bacterium]